MMIIELQEVRSTLLVFEITLIPCIVSLFPEKHKENLFTLREGGLRDQIQYSIQAHPGELISVLGYLQEQG